MPRPCYFLVLTVWDSFVQEDGTNRRYSYMVACFRSRKTFRAYKAAIEKGLPPHHTLQGKVTRDRGVLRRLGLGKSKSIRKNPKSDVINLKGACIPR